MCVADVIAEEQINRREMVKMRVGYDKIFHAGIVKPVLKHMHIRVRREIDKQIVVDYCLRAGTDITSAGGSCAVAMFTATEYRRPAFCRRGAEITEIHFNTSGIYYRNYTLYRAETQ